MSATVLIVDDEENARLNIGSFLELRGYETIGVATLSEARETLNRGNADIILLDVELPDGYGPNLLEETAHLPMRPSHHFNHGLWGYRNGGGGDEKRSH